MINNAVTYRYSNIAREISSPIFVSMQGENSLCTEAIGCDVLIGMDIISMVDFAITSGLHGTIFSFKTPHGEEIDFTV